MNYYAVMGRPVAHSRSPFLFKCFSEQTHQPLHYEAIEATPDTLLSELHRFQQRGGKGVNITLPLKETAYKLASELSERARTAKAVNVISIGSSPSSFYGDNVDGIGLIRDLTHYYQYPLTGKRVLVIGAGGAVRGILPALLNEAPAKTTIVNRTVAKALALASEFGVNASTWDQLSGETYDLVINGTSASLTQTPLPLPDGILSQTACCYDMVYGQHHPLFLQWAEKNGALLSCDGLGMLIEQAAETFYLWHGIKPETLSIRSIMKGN